MVKTPEQKFWNDPKVVEEFFKAKTSPYWKKFLSSLEKPYHYHILDLGCGGGRNTEFIAKTGFDTWACDLHSSMVKATRERLRGLISNKDMRKRIVKATMLKLPFRANSFDIIIANGVYHNADSLKHFTNAVKETSRVLKKDGFLCLNVFYKGIIASELKKTGPDTNTFITKEGLCLILLPKRKILSLLKNSRFLPFEKITTYNRKVSTGLRSVFRGVFKKF
ncbi:MAG: class I SAM-dependent methyltransferase [Candidatus Jorgensenbacteria bacterium]|nr:class I SAM-dependent methyltransferase [Candidatus Jorgensenbacteria bacterium]